MQKKKYGHGLYSGYRTNTKLHEAECRANEMNRPDAPNGGYKYWKEFYLSGRRRIAKDRTNRAIRAFYRMLLSTLSETTADDIPCLRCADYEKMSDYEWTVY